MNDTPLKSYGLIPEILSARTPTAHALFGSPSPSLIADTFEVPDLVGPVDQGDTNFCTCYTSRELETDIKGEVYDENWNVAATSRLYGQPILQGAPATLALRALRIYGGNKLSAVPSGMTWQDKGQAFIADWKNWDPSLFESAASNELPGAVDVIDGPLDAFDSIRAQMQMHKRSIALATPWYAFFNSPDSSGAVPDLPLTGPSSWHMYAAKRCDVIGTTQVIWMKPWEGAGFGKGGYVALTRSQVNALLANPQANALMIPDVPVADPSQLGTIEADLEDFFSEIRARFMSLTQNNG